MPSLTRSALFSDSDATKNALFAIYHNYNQVPYLSTNSLYLAPNQPQPAHNLDTASLGELQSHFYHVTRVPDTSNLNLNTELDTGIDLGFVQNGSVHSASITVNDMISHECSAAGTKPHRMRIGP